MRARVAPHPGAVATNQLAGKLAFAPPLLGTPFLHVGEGWFRAMGRQRAGVCRYANPPAKPCMELTLPSIFNLAPPVQRRSSARLDLPTWLCVEPTLVKSCTRATLHEWC